MKNIVPPANAKPNNKPNKNKGIPKYLITNGRNFV